MNIDELEDLYIEELKDKCNFKEITDLHRMVSEFPQIKEEIGKGEMVPAEYSMLCKAFCYMYDRQILSKTKSQDVEKFSDWLILSPEEMYEVVINLSELNQTNIINRIKVRTSGERIQLKECIKKQDKNKWNEILSTYDIDDVSKIVGYLGQLHILVDSTIEESSQLGKKISRLMNYVSPQLGSDFPTMIGEYLQDKGITIEDSINFINSIKSENDLTLIFPNIQKHLETLIKYYYFTRMDYSYDEKEIIDTILSLPYIDEMKENIFKECGKIEKKVNRSDNSSAPEEDSITHSTQLSKKPKYKSAIIIKLAHRLAGTPNPNNDANFKVQKIFIHQDQIGLFCYFLTGEVTPGDFDMDKMDNEILWEGTWQSFKYLLYKLYGISLPPNCAIAVTEKFRFNASKTQKVKEKTFKGSNWARIVKDIKSKTDVTLDEKSEIDYLDEILKFLS